MSNDLLDEREFELVNIIGAKLGSNQRELSAQMDLSLGMVNMLIRRLIAKGYIRINQLNKRKVEYILTPKGFSEKINKSVNYTMKTIHSMGLIKNRLKDILHQFVEAGERKFVILGKSDFALLIEMTLREMGVTGYLVEYINNLPEGKMGGALLICREGEYSTGPHVADHCINLVQELAKDNLFVSY